MHSPSCRSHTDFPRDDGALLPFALPELDGVPIYDHDRIPSIERTDHIDESLVVRSYKALASPPTNLPERTNGMVFGRAGRDMSEADIRYELAPASELEHIQAFTGPRSIRSVTMGRQLTD